MEIRLPANFSTGYRWVLEPALQAGHVTSENYLKESSGPMAGTPGIQTFRVVFPRDGRFNLKFAYRRLWEPSTVPPSQTTNLVVLVTPRKSPPSMLETLFPPKAPSNIPQPEEDQTPPPARPVELRRTR